MPRGLETPVYGYETWEGDSSRKEDHSRDTEGSQVRTRRQRGRPEVQQEEVGRTRFRLVSGGVPDSPGPRFRWAGVLVQRRHSSRLFLRVSSFTTLRVPPRPPPPPPEVFSAPEGRSRRNPSSSLVSGGTVRPAHPPPTKCSVYPETDVESGRESVPVGSPIFSLI